MLDCYFGTLYFQLMIAHTLMSWEPRIFLYLCSLVASIGRLTLLLMERPSWNLTICLTQSSRSLNHGQSHPVWNPVVPCLFRHLATCSLPDSPAQRCTQSDHCDISPQFHMVGHPSLYMRPNTLSLAQA